MNTTGINIHKWIDFSTIKLAVLPLNARLLFTVRQCELDHITVVPNKEALGWASLGIFSFELIMRSGT
jgi:hypothetical protein